MVDILDNLVYPTNIPLILPGYVAVVGTWLLPYESDFHAVVDRFSS